MKKLLLLFSLFLITLVVAIGSSYSGTTSPGDLAGTANNTNYTLTFAEPTLVTTGNSSNYTMTVGLYAVALDPNIPPVENGDDDDDDSPSGGGGGGGLSLAGPTLPTGEEVKSFSSLVSSADKEIILKSPREDVVFEEMLVLLTEDKENVQIRIIESNANSEREELASFTGNPYKVLDIEHELLSDGDIVQATLRFKVEKSWATQWNAEPEELLLYHYDGNTWNPLETKYEESDELYYYFIAYSPGLSIFLIGVEEPILPTKVVTTPVQVPSITAQVAADTVNQTDKNVTDPNTDPYYNPNTSSSDNNSLIFAITSVVVCIGIIVFIMRKKARSKKKISGSATTLSGHKIDKNSKEVSSATPAEAHHEQTPRLAPESLHPLFESNDEEILYNFIQDLLKRGFTVEQFKSKLVAKGWSLRQINHCLERLEKK
jgi:PGF-pre-PGF domain-containing protein